MPSPTHGPACAVGWVGGPLLSPNLKPRKQQLLRLEGGVGGAWQARVLGALGEQEQPQLSHSHVPGTPPHSLCWRGARARYGEEGEEWGEGERQWVGNSAENPPVPG